MNLPDWISPYGPIIGFGVAIVLYISDDIRQRRRCMRLREIISLHHDAQTMKRAAVLQQTPWALDEYMRLEDELEEAEKREGIPR